MGWVIRRFKADIVCDSCAHKTKFGLKDLKILGLAIPTTDVSRIKAALRRNNWRYIGTKCFCPKCSTDK